MSNSEKEEEKDASDSFSLTSKEGQKHLKALNDELKALNEQGSSQLSLLHGPQIQSGSSFEQTIKKTPRKRKNFAESSKKKHKLLKKKQIALQNVKEDNAESNASDCETAETEIDNLLEEKAWKANLSAVNVKNILRYVVTNEQVLAMIDHKMKLQDGLVDGETSVFEPKLTRSKTKELLQKEVKLPWPISPIKSPTPSKRLIDLFEVSDSEASSDEEYQPELSFENTFGFTENEESAHSPPTSESELINESSVSEDVDVLEPQSDDYVEPIESTIALRTRSKLPLNDTPLETIEANFIAPDITVDMYDEECDDEEWKDFLGEFLKPLDTTSTVVDDDVNDPEYNFLEEEDVPDVEDLRDDRAVRITKKELHELMAELLESTEMDYAETEDDFSKSELSATSSTIAMPTRPNLVFNDNLEGISNYCYSEELFNFQRKQLLAEQMRKHVQLLLQMFLIASEKSVYTNLRDMSKNLLVELHTFAIKNQSLYGQSTFFSPINLKNALDLALNFDIGYVASRPASSALKGSSNKHKISDQVLSAMLHSDAFLYPALLPTCGLKTPAQYKSSFTVAEDNLLALGLEQFLPLRQFSCWYLIREHMIPIKTSKQILIRVKNLKSKSKDPDNPVKYFYQNNRAPQFNNVAEPFSPLSVCPLFKLGKKLLPENFQVFLSENHKLGKQFSKPAAIARKLLPIPEVVDPDPLKHSPMQKLDKEFPYVPLHKIEAQGSPKKAPVEFKAALVKNAEKEPILKTPEKNSEGKSHLNMPILSASPNCRLTPLKQVSPILKKYNYNSLRKTGGNMRNTIKPLPKLMPKYVVVKKKGLRTLAPKATTSASTTTTQNLVKENQEKLQNVKENFAASVEEKVKESNCQPVPIADSIFSNSQITEDSPVVECHEFPPSAQLHLDKETNQSTAAVESQKDVQATDFRDSGSEAEVEMFDDGDDTADDELVDVHADNEDDLAALMAASTTIKSIPKQKQSIIKRKKQKSDRKALLALLSCDTFEMDMSVEKENAFAEAYLQRVKDVVGVNSTFEEFLKLLHDFNSSDKNVAELYAGVCKILKDYPELCDEFVTFLLPEQAIECGKFMEYLNLTRMQVFLKKLEAHFGKHPQHMQKLIKVISQVQQLENPGMDDLNKAIIPLFRGQQHLIEEFLQLFPQEPVPKSRMTDFEEIYIPNGEEELTVDERGYETIASLPDQNDTYGGPDCPCACHSSEKPKVQNRLKHCVECGIKFIDGRIFLQTGKILKPCKIMYLNPVDDAKQTEGSHDNSKQVVHVLPSVIISPTSSASSLSPSIQSDDDKAHQSVQEQGVKIIPSSLTSASNALEMPNCTDSGKTLQMSLPSDVVTEDAILTVDTTGKKSYSFVPADFSAFRQVISQKAARSPVESASSSICNRDKREGTKRASKVKTYSNPSDDVPSDDVRANDSVSTVAQSKLENSNKWTRECDRILLQNCQRLKACKETFELTASQLGSRTAEEPNPEKMPIRKKCHFCRSWFKRATLS